MSTSAHSALRSAVRAAVPPRVAVVIPCYRVGRHIGAVLREIGPEVSLIYAVDDACPEGSGDVARLAAAGDPRFRLIRHAQNAGVGGAVVSGYRQALADGAEVIVKVDGDGQMDPRRIPELIGPILSGEADYVKANRFYDVESVRAMPWARLIGNAGLSFLSKLSSGYWDVFDPTNGYTAIHAAAAQSLPLEKLARRYFFESDILFRLNTIRAVVLDVPLAARYADEKSNLSVSKALLQFPFYHLRNFFKRILYNYLLRDFNMASLNLAVGLLCTLFGTLFGIRAWAEAAQHGALASSGTVMVAALPVILGVQFLLSFVNFDMSNLPQFPLQRRLGARRRWAGEETPILELPRGELPLRKSA
jgi:dolichol-phosphate mannosyltransferase